MSKRAVWGSIPGPPPQGVRESMLDEPRRALDGTNNWSNIAGAHDQNSYVVQASDGGMDLRVIVTYTDGGGTPETLTSNVLDPVLDVNGQNAAVAVQSQPDAPASVQQSQPDGTASVHLSTSANETLTGGSGVDVFRFAKDFGHDTVEHFTAGEDVIELQSGLFSSIDDLLAHHAVQVGSDVVISDAAGDMLTLKGVTLDKLHASDFHLA